MTLIFDIGKTHKKCLLFDADYQLIELEEQRFAEIEDEDGFPCDDLTGILRWMEDRLDFFLKKYPAITHLNFSTYGASLVHVDQKGKPLTPLYNYLKPLPADIRKRFYQLYGPAEKLAQETASPALDMLNSGLQLYWLKHSQPEVFARIHRSLHFPQFLGFYFSGKAGHDATSLGCHTALWDFGKKAYHAWVQAEKLAPLFPAPELLPTTSSITYQDKKLMIGYGLHDSSAALYPYLKASDTPFVLLSTGTWSIALNPFQDAPLTQEELAQDVLFYLQPDQRPVKAARLFLGKEHEVKVADLVEFYGVDKNAYRQVAFSPERTKALKKQESRHFVWQQLPGPGPTHASWQSLSDFTTAYHQLLIELVDRQVQSLRLIWPDLNKQRLIIEGGFAKNGLFLALLQQALPEVEIFTAETAHGSALGAALIMESKPLHSDFLSENYSLRKYQGSRGA